MALLTLEPTMIKLRSHPITRALAVPCAAVLVILLSACAKPEAPAPLPPTVYVTPVRNETSADFRTLSGTVRPRIESDLSFRVGGKVTARLVDLGQSVRAGQTLAQLDPADYALGVAASVEQLKLAQVDAAQAASDAARFKRLLVDGSVGAAEVERQQARADAAVARSNQAKHQLDLARNRVGYATLTAPFDGIVTALRLEAGQTVADGNVVMTLAKPEELEVVVDVPESLAAGLRSQQAWARFESSVFYTSQQVAAATPTEFNLKLRELAPSAAAARTFRARYALPLAKGGAGLKDLRMGMTATVRLTQNSAQNAGKSGSQSAAELPLGAVTALIGVPFFLMRLRRLR